MGDEGGDHQLVLDSYELFLKLSDIPQFLWNWTEEKELNYILYLSNMPHQTMLPTVSRKTLFSSFWRLINTHYKCKYVLNSRPYVFRLQLGAGG